MEKGATRRKERRGGCSDEEDVVTRGKERQGGRSNEESEKMKKFEKKVLFSCER